MPKVLRGPSAACHEAQACSSADADVGGICVIQEMGLPEDPNVPLLGFIGRLDYQKGVDLIRDSYDWMMGEGVQLIMLGSGRGDLEDSLR